MSDRRRWAVSVQGEAEPGRVARFLLVALGLMGFVLLPGPGPAPGGPGIGVRTGAVQPPAQTAPGRGRGTETRSKCVVTIKTGRTAAPCQQHASGVAAPPSRPSLGRPPALATRPAGRTAPIVAGAPVGPARGRAPPSSMGF